MPISEKRFKKVENDLEELKSLIRQMVAGQGAAPVVF